MNEIKYRVWDKYIKGMIHFESFKDFGKWLYQWYEPKRYVLLQYTGRKDKNGNEMYVDDIIIFFVNTRYGEIKKTGIIRCEDLAEGCYVKFLPHELHGMKLDFEVENPEVIGNANESPALPSQTNHK